MLHYDEAILAQDGEEAAGTKVKHASMRRLLREVAKDWAMGWHKSVYRRQAREARARRARDKAELETWRAGQEARLQRLREALRQAGGEGE